MPHRPSIDGTVVGLRGGPLPGAAVEVCTVTGAGSDCANRGRVTADGGGRFAVGAWTRKGWAAGKLQVGYTVLVVCNDGDEVAAVALVEGTDTPVEVALREGRTVTVDGSSTRVPTSGELTIQASHLCASAG